MLIPGVILYRVCALLLTCDKKIYIRIRDSNASQVVLKLIQRPIGMHLKHLQLRHAGVAELLYLQ